MDNSPKKIVIVPALPPDCLREILQYVPMLERVRLREVSREWRDAADRSWSSIRTLSISDGLCRGSIDTKIVPTGTAINVTTKNLKLAKGLVNHCGKFLRCLRVERCRVEGVSFSVLPEAVESCRQLEELQVGVETVAEDNQLSSLLRLNPRIKSISVTVTTLCYDFFNCISKDTLEELTLMSAIPEVRFFCEIIIRGLNCTESMEHVHSVIRDSRGLKKLTINWPSQKLLEFIGEKTDLEHLSVAVPSTDSAFRLVHTDTVSRWDNIFNLSCLRELQIYTARNNDQLFDTISSNHKFVTDDFVEKLVHHCPRLETVVLNNCLSLTDRAVHALSSLPLRKLGLRTMRGEEKITDHYLMHFGTIEELELVGRRLVGDAGVVELLRGCRTIQVLNLEGTGVTNRTLIAAIEETKRRESGVRLTVHVGDTKANVSDVDNTSPLLTLIDG